MDAVESIRGAISASWFGAAIPPEALARLEAIGRLREVDRGAVLLREGAETAELSLIVEGRVVLTESVPGRQPMTLMTVEPGDIFGWSVLLAPYRATSTVTAVERTRIAGFPGPALRAAMRQEAALAAVVYRQVLDAVARRLVVTRAQLMDLYRLDSNEPW